MLDCVGLPCPQPVIKTRELLEAENPESLQVLVDNAAASENVSRFLKSRGYAAVVEKQAGGFLVKAGRDQSLAISEAEPMEAYSCGLDAAPARICVLVKSEFLGQGDDRLGAGLMKNFIATLKEMGPELWRLVFVNSGVKLCCRGAECLADLQALAAGGVSILVCGTCLNHFGLLEAKEVGETTNMLDVVTSLQLADKTISI